MRDRLTLPPVCPACGLTADLVSQEEFYGRTYQAGRCVYRCPAGCAHVGTHGDGVTPLGAMATADLRHLRADAHAAFDAWWRAAGMSRRAAYAALSKALGVREAHIGYATAEERRTVIGLFEGVVR